MNPAKKIAYAFINMRHPTVPPTKTTYKSRIATPSQSSPGQNRTGSAGGARSSNRQRAHHTSGE